MPRNRTVPRQARNLAPQLGVSDEKVKDIVKNLGIYQPSQELEGMIRVVGNLTEGFVDDEQLGEAIDSIDNQLLDLSGLIDTNTNSIDSLNSSVVDINYKADEALLRSDALVGLVSVNNNNFQDAIDRALVTGARGIILPAGRIATLTSTVALPNQITQVVIDGEVICTADVPVFTRTGVTEGSASVNITSNILAGQRTVTVNTTGYAVGDWVFVISADTLPGTTDKLGYMRQIRSMTATTATFDTAFPRDMPSSTRRMRKIALASPLTLSGVGKIRYTDPESKVSPMIVMTFTKDVRILNLELRDGGGAAVKLQHVVGAEVNCRIDNFIDDIANGHVGYGVDISGATRNAVVRGIISRCRHACTTNVGPNLTQFVFYGEPEGFTMEPLTFFCTDKALDTHRAGFGGRMILNDMGSGGGVHVRCDGIYAEGIAQGETIGAAFWADTDLVSGPTVGPFKVINHAATGFQISSNTKFVAMPDFYNLAGSKFVYSNNAYATFPAERQVVIAAANTTVNNSTTPVPVTGLSLTLEPNSTYELSGFISMLASQAADITFSWSYPTGSLITWTGDGLSTGATSSGGSIVRQVRVESDVQALGGVGGSIRTSVLPKGIVTTGSTGGQLTLLMAQFVATADNAIVYSGSYLTATKIN